MKAADLTPNSVEIFRQFLDLCRVGKLKWQLVWASFFLLLMSAFFEGASFSLLLPFLGTASGSSTDYLGGAGFSPLNFRIYQLLPAESLTLGWILALIVFSVVMKEVSGYVSRVFFMAAQQSLENQLRGVAYKRLLGYGCLFFDLTKKGRLQNTLMNYSAQISEMMRIFFSLLQSFFVTIVYFVLLFQLSPELTGAVLLIAPVFHWSLQSFFGVARKIYSRLLKGDQQIHGVAFDALNNIKLVKSFSREAHEIHRFQKLLASRTRDHVIGYGLQTLLAPLLEVLIVIGLAGLVGAYFYYLPQKNSGEVFKLVISLLLIRRAIQGGSSLTQMVPSILKTFPGVTEFRKLINLKDKHIISCGDREFHFLKKSLEGRSLTMSYHPKEVVLRDVNFEIAAGSFTAIVGPSGSGKTTLAELILRFYDYQGGDILLDGISIRDYSLESLRKEIGFVPQDTQVLNDTLYHNIHYALPEASPESVYEAARAAYVMEFAERFEKGLDTVIGDKGVKLSGGELQRLSLARIFLRKPSLLILDEATSALDSVSEKRIQESLDILCKGRTVIAVAHRLSTIKHADKIIVLQNGRVVESGTLNDLLEQGGVFRQLWEAQKFD